MRNINWRRVILGGLSAGVALLAVQLVSTLRWAASIGGFFLRSPIRLMKSLVLGVTSGCISCRVSL